MSLSHKIQMRLGMLIAGILIAGCATGESVSKDQTQENQNEAASAIKSVAGSYTGKKMSDNDMKNLARDLEKDKEGQSAVKTITGSMSGGHVVMYCPVDGKRFSSRFKICPEHHILLKEVE